MRPMRLTPARAACLAAALLIAGCQRAEQTPAAATAASAPAAAPVNPALAQDLRARADALLAAHRQMIVLMSDERALDPATRRAVSTVGQMLFHDLLAKQEALLGLAARTTDPATVPALNALLDVIESEPSWFDADRLAFKEFLARLATTYGNAQSLPGLKLARRAADDVAVLAEVEAAYDKELKEIFGRYAQRGIELKREKWADYVAKLRGVYTREQILRDYATIVPYREPPPEKGSKPGSAPRSEADAREIFGTSLPPKTVVLTFDDGPHPRYTDEILDILKRFDAPAIFFHLGRNLGAVGTDGKPRPGAQMAVAQRVLAAGHQLANHSYSHSVMAKLAEVAVRDEAANTEALLDAAGRTPSALFRFPYGARNEGSLSTVEALKLRSMMWNIDSMDWADPVPKSIAERVLAETAKAGRGVILFHDIQARTVQALPLVLDQLVADGYRFAIWKDGRFVVSPGRKGAPDTAPSAGDALYRDSHALIIGIDRYTQWPALQYAVRDAKAMQDTLLTRFGFKPENVTLLTDAQATRTNILSALNQKLADSKQVKRDDRVFVFYAGHGGTRKLASGRDVGYLIPVDAPQGDFASEAVSMPQLQEVAEALAAKHVLFVIDACYSGLGLTRAGGSTGGSRNFLADNARRQGRQMMTAGGADQQVADDGPGGHSAFTWTLLQALQGKADLNGDGFITGTELAAYVAPAVSSIARQTPAFGNLPGSEGGEFVFELPVEREALSGDSRQLDAGASALAQRIAAAQPSASAPVVVVKNLDGSDNKLTVPAAADLPPRVAAQRDNDRGLVLYRERRYDEAEAAFTEALKHLPRFALAANNLGFVYYKRGKPVEAARWFEKAIEMDGSRALAWLNLGDAQLLAGDEAKAATAYATFVGLAPKHPRAAEIQAWVAAPGQAPKPKPPV